MARLNRAGRPRLALGLRALGAGGFALLLAGCGGGSSTLTPTGVAGPAASGSKRLAATLTIKIPPKRAAKGARSPKYVSPATQSIAVSFTPAAGGNAQTFNQNLTPGSPGCTASLVSPLICVVTLSLAPDSYVANFTTYDGVLDHNGDPQGNVLSQNQGAGVTIAPAAANSINVTLQGVPAGVAIRKRIFVADRHRSRAGRQSLCGRRRDRSGHADRAQRQPAARLHRKRLRRSQQRRAGQQRHGLRSR